MPLYCKLIVATILAVTWITWYYCSDYAGSTINNGLDGTNGSSSCGYCVVIQDDLPSDIKTKDFSYDLE